jgi:hypothetical protein
VGGLIVAGSAINAGDPVAVSAVIDGDINANMNFSSKVLDMKVSTITNTSANFIQFEENLFVRPPLGQTTAGGSVSIVNGAGCSNFNQYSLAVNGDGVLGGQLALTRFQGASSFPVFNVDNDGNMLFKDPGAIVYADNFSTIALQAGSVTVAGTGRTLISTGSPTPTVTLTSAGTIGNIDFGGAIGEFIPVVVGGVYTLQGSIAVTASAGLSKPFTVSVVCSDGVNPGTGYTVYGQINTGPYATGTGALATVYLPVSMTLKADFDKIAVSCSASTLAAAETVTVDMGPVTLTRSL